MYYFVFIENKRFHSLCLSTFHSTRELCCRQDKDKAERRLHSIIVALQGLQPAAIGTPPRLRNATPRTTFLSHLKTYLHNNHSNNTLGYKLFVTSVVLIEPRHLRLRQLSRKLQLHV